MAPATGPARAPVILDARWRLAGPPGIDSYQQGHLPGAVFADLDRDLAGPPGPPGPGGRHPLPDPAAFQAAMRAAGVSRGRPVVVYDDGDGMAAARGWWTLRYFGHADVRVLDGGYRAWTEAGLPVTTDRTEPAPGDFTAEPGHMPVLDAAGAQATARDGLLLDARSGERYRGEAEHVDPVAGHIPGAVSAPTASNANPDGTFRDPAELASRFAALGAVPSTSSPAGAPPDAPGTVPGTNPQPGAPADAPGTIPGTTPLADAPADARGTGTPPAAPVGAYCGSGVTAAHEVLALALAGIPAALYVGSWSDWITDPSRPVATGP
ncbi:MAG TPA: rhodanese-like domain-containing protein [Streptosporangiaceae bacterium]|nr:rhodanese-like domain-containing protein [Streptosporangiaceae bacterium]